MDAVSREKFVKAVDMLREAGERIRDIEKRAAEALHGGGDEAGYRALMREKCEVMMGLPEQGEKILAGATGAIVDDLRAELASYAARAGQAVKVGSVFFMSALLYPDEYKDGDPNDLEEAVARFAELA